MEQPSEAQESHVKRSRNRWRIGSVALLLFYVILSWFSPSTRLLASHGKILGGFYVAAGLCGLVFAFVAAGKMRATAMRRRAVLMMAVAMVACIFMFQVVRGSARVVEGWTDFPKGTETRPMVLSISRAYRTPGQDRGWTIQTAPTFSQLLITQHDYDFMLSHRRPGDKSSNPDEIFSKGYFCAHVIAQQSGPALRVMHAGAEQLPEGTVATCLSAD